LPCTILGSGLEGGGVKKVVLQKAGKGKLTLVPSRRKSARLATEGGKDF
jgi:hypothetical protein